MAVMVVGLVRLAFDCEAWLSLFTRGVSVATSSEDVHEKLRAVIDPEIGINIVDLGLIYDVRWSPTRQPKESLRLNLTTSMPPSR